MKYLVIAALFLLFLLLVYSKIYPYIQMVKKILGAATTIADAPRGDQRATTKQIDRKLVRCVRCGTWIPAERAIGQAAGQSVYCSRECIEGAANGNERKMAG